MQVTPAVAYPLQGPILGGVPTPARGFGALAEGGDSVLVELESCPAQPVGLPNGKGTSQCRVGHSGIASKRGLREVGQILAKWVRFVNDTVAPRVIAEPQPGVSGVRCSGRVNGRSVAGKSTLRVPKL